RHRLEVAIWLAPFHVAGASKLAAAHREWLLTASDATPLVDPRLGRPYHILDPTHPDVARFLAELFHGLRKDGFTYFKLDFLYGAAYEATRHDPEVTGTQALRLGLKQIVDAVNPPGKPEKAFILACGAPLMPIVGLVHGARTGGDVGVPQMEDGKAGPPHVGFPLIPSTARNQAALPARRRPGHAAGARARSLAQPNRAWPWRWSGGGAGSSLQCARARGP